MRVKNFFNDIEYPKDFKSREKIFKQYHEKINHISGGEMKKKDFNMTILLDLFAIIGVIAVFMYGEVSIILKAVYIIPSIIFAIYDLFLACKVKYKECNEKNLYKKQVSMLTLVNIYIFLGTYIFQVISLGDKFTNQICIFSLIAFIVLTLGSILKARKDSPKRFINDFLYKENKYHSQPSWALNITRILIVLVCLFKPYMLVMGLGYILLSPYTYYITYAYYIYSQYDNVQQLQKKKEK